MTINTPDSDGVLPTQPLAASKVIPLGRPVQVAVKFVLFPAMTTQRVGYKTFIFGVGQMINQSNRRGHRHRRHLRAQEFADDHIR